MWENQNLWLTAKFDPINLGGKISSMNCFVEIFGKPNFCWIRIVSFWTVRFSGAFKIQINAVEYLYKDDSTTFSASL